MIYNELSNNPIERNKITHSFVYWDNAFSVDEIDQLDYMCSKEPLDQATTFGSTDPEEVKKVRNSKVKFFNRDMNTNWVFERFNSVGQKLNEQFYNFNLNGYSVFQYTLYDGTEQGRYDWHMDMGLGGDPNSTITNETRKLTMVMLLTQPGIDFTGGEFEINQSDHNHPLVPEFVKGRIIAFPSFVIHRVKPVLSGIRKSIVIWIEGPKFI